MANRSKLMTPLFIDGMFNKDGRRMYAVFEKEITDGNTTYALWRSAGKPDVGYPRAENDKYYLFAHLNGRLLPLCLTEWSLIDRCGYDAAVTNLYGSKEARQEHFDRLRQFDGGYGIAAALETEQIEIERCGNEPARQTAYIRKLLEGHVSAYLSSKEDGGKSFPDFIGALVMNELPKCVELSAVHKSLRAKEREEFVAREAAKAKEHADSVNNELEQTVLSTLQIIKSGGVVENQKVVYYETPNCGKACSLINFLMRRYNVEVPIRTQGWIEGMLTKVKVENGRCLGTSFLRSKKGRGSQSFYRYMDELISIINGKPSEVEQ